MKHFQFSLIKTYREEKNMTQVELARIMGDGATKSQICSFERGRGKGLTVRTLARLADALGKSTDDFFTE